MDLIHRLKAYGCSLIAGGGISRAADAVYAIEAGADAVAVAAAAMADAAFCQKLQVGLRDHRTS